MNSRERRVKGVENIRSHSSKAHDVAHPHQAYLRIAMLELERKRRLHERAGVAQRVQSIDARLAQITVEKTALEQRLGVAAAAAQATLEQHPETAVAAATAAKEPPVSRFHLRY